MRHTRITLSALLLASCVNTMQAPTALPPTHTQEPTRTVAPTLVPTDTPYPTSTPTRWPTSTATPTNTPLPSPTATYTPRPTLRPTRIPPTPTPLPTARAASSRPVEPFDVDAFIERLTNAHHDYQMIETVVGHAMQGVGECRVAFYYWDSYVHAPTFANVPEAWLPFTTAYVTLMDGAAEVMLPIINVCRAGGGTIDDATDRRIIDFFDQAQNRMYQMMKEAEAVR